MSQVRSTSSAMISVIEKARGREDAPPSARLFSVLLMAVFFIALMGGLAAGASLYRSATTAQTRANELHLESGLLTNVIRGNDTAGTVSEGEGPEGPALVLTRTLSSGRYETRIYLYQGKLMQELSVAGRPYDPLGATELLSSKTFSFEVADGLVHIATDDGSFDVALRSDPEASAAAEQATDALAREVEVIL